MYQKTLSYYITMLYRSFADFTGDKLQEVGLNFGLLFFIVYIGKKPNCTPSELTKALSLDWGHSQRCINRLTDDGFITKEKSGRHYLLNLTERGQEAFEATGTSPMITMAQPPAAILRIFSKYSSSARPKVVGAKMMRFFNSKPP